MSLQTYRLSWGARPKAAHARQRIFSGQANLRPGVRRLADTFASRRPLSPPGGENPTFHTPQRKGFLNDAYLKRIP